VFFRSIWKERNIIIFKGDNCKSLRSLRNDIIILARYWCLKKQDLLDKLHLILPQDVMLLSVQVLGSTLELVLVEGEVGFGEGTDPSARALLSFWILIPDSEM
jgi:hypothetical protein